MVCEQPDLSNIDFKWQGFPPIFGRYHRQDVAHCFVGIGGSADQSQAQTVFQLLEWLRYSDALLGFFSLFKRVLTCSCICDICAPVCSYIARKGHSCCPLLLAQFLSLLQVGIRKIMRILSNFILVNGVGIRSCALLRLKGSSLGILC